MGVFAYGCICLWVYLLMGVFAYGVFAYGGICLYAYECIFVSNCVKVFVLK